MNEQKREYDIRFIAFTISWNWWKTKLGWSMFCFKRIFYWNGINEGLAFSLTNRSPISERAWKQCKTICTFLRMLISAHIVPTVFGLRLLKQILQELPLVGKIRTCSIYSTNHLTRLKFFSSNKRAQLLISVAKQVTARRSKKLL